MEYFFILGKKCVILVENLKAFKNRKCIHDTCKKKGEEKWHRKKKIGKTQCKRVAVQVSKWLWGADESHTKTHGCKNELKIIMEMLSAR